jgi:hypothetical protein
VNSIFLSASVPKPGREFYGTADPLLIHAAVRALLALTLGRRHIVWGGHPSITPMVWAACAGLNVDYAKAVTLYQSKFFQRHFPKANVHFNVTLIDGEADAALSLTKLREVMFTKHAYESAVFIGGMNGVIEEHDLLRTIQPGATCLTVPRPGGAAEALAKKNGYDCKNDRSPTDFTQLFIDALKISPSEPRALTQKP